MTEHDRLIAETSERLRQHFTPIFDGDAGTAANAAEMLIGPLRSETDLQKLSAALARLPSGSRSRPTFLVDRQAGEGNFAAVLVARGVEYRDAKRFATAAQAERHAREFIERLQAEINREN